MIGRLKGETKQKQPEKFPRRKHYTLCVKMMKNIETAEKGEGKKRVVCKKKKNQ